MKYLNIGIFLTLFQLIISSTSSSSSTSCSSSNLFSYQQITRHYCIQSKEVSWNYSPNVTIVSNSYKRYDLTNKYETNAQKILNVNYPSMGNVFLKAVYKQYEYNEKSKKCNWNNEIVNENNINGFLGPTIRAVVGDTINVHYFNNCSRTYSIKPHGLYFSQDFEDNVLPGEEVKYTWYALEGSGPESDSISSKLWMYQSLVNLQYDLNSGLFGAIVVVNPKYITTDNEKKNAFPCDIDFEYNIAMTTIDETNSWYFKQNMKLNFGRQISDSDLQTYQNNQEFVNANMRYSMNGYMFGNLNQYIGLSLSKDSIIRWNILNINTNTNIEDVSIQWDEYQVYNFKDSKSNYITLNSPGYTTIDMNPTEDQLLSSLFLYNLDEEKQSQGMIGIYQVIDDNYKSKTTSTNSSVSNSSKGFFIFVIISSVIATIVLLYYNFYKIGPLSNVGDMSPILLESSHHFPVQSNQPSNSTKESGSSDIESEKKNVNRVKHAEI